MHRLYEKADKLSREVIGAAMEVHRHKGPGLIESIYERCLLRELELRSIPATTQKLVCVEYKGLVFDEPLRFDILVDNCLLLELKAAEILHPSSKAQLFSYMKLLDIPIGLLINFHELVLKNGISPNDLARSESNRRKRWRRGLALRKRYQWGLQTEIPLFVTFVSFCEQNVAARTRSVASFGRRGDLRRAREAVTLNRGLRRLHG